MARTDDSAAYAVNWRHVLAADGLVGLAGVVIGLVVLAVGSLAVGAGLAALGVMYLVAVGRRWRRWARLRAEAGL
jgi:hypothetical protein